LRSFILLLALLAAAPLSAKTSEQLCGVEARSCPEYGAHVFQQRCALCHGSDGRGEGALALAIADYPETNLLKARYGKDRAALTRIITHGASLEELSPEMPPWGDELTATQLESVVAFVDLLHREQQQAVAMLRAEAERGVATVRQGRGIYRGRCALCHGDFGEGDGKMAKIINNPPPFNLTWSRVPESYMRQIIGGGGASVGRSPRMPPWGDELNEVELESVILYVKTLRK